MTEVKCENAVYEEITLADQDCIAVKENVCYEGVNKLKIKKPGNKSSSKKFVVLLTLNFFTLVLLLGAVAASTGYTLFENTKLRTEIASCDSKIIQMQSLQDQKYSTLEYKVSQVQNSSQAAAQQISVSFAMLQQLVAQNDSTLGDSIALLENQIREINNTLSSCGGLGWRRVGYLDMTDPSQSCPSGLALKTYSPGLRSCGRASNSSGCWSTFYSPYSGPQYSRVCGRVRGYQLGNTAAFYSHTSSINGPYVTGISLTHGSSGHRTHIWTFASGLAEVDGGTFSNEHCPCVTSAADPPPSFVGNDYFCESGINTRWNYQYIFSLNDPLWDGENCVSSCCEFNNPPYFSKTLSAPTTDQIELRICNRSNGENSDTSIDQIEVYVQ